VAILLLSQGVPMLLGGDEVLRTQGGNNNGYCHNNALSWFDWGLVEANQEMFDFVSGMIRLRQCHPSLRRERFLTGTPHRGQTLPDIAWHGVKLGTPRWDDRKSRCLAFTLAGITPEEPPLHVMLNMHDRPLDFALPALPDHTWHMALDTATTPALYAPGEQPAVTAGRYPVAGRSVVVLEGWSG
jgi:glycogen operon protein